MKEEKILITIDRNGKIEADAQGFQGEACVEDLKKILGEVVPVRQIEKKDEYFQKGRIAAKRRIVQKK